MGTRARLVAGCVVAAIASGGIVLFVSSRSTIEAEDEAASGAAAPTSPEGLGTRATLAGRPSAEHGAESGSAPIVDDVHSVRGRVVDGDKNPAPSTVVVAFSYDPDEARPADAPIVKTAIAD